MTQKRNRQAVQIGWGRDWCLCDPIFTGDGGETRKIRTEWLLKDSGEAEVHLFIISLFLFASSLLLCRGGCFVSADDFSLFLAFHSQYKLSRLGQTHLSPVSSSNQSETQIQFPSSFAIRTGSGFKCRIRGFFHKCWSIRGTSPTTKEGQTCRDIKIPSSQSQTHL